MSHFLKKYCVILFFLKHYYHAFYLVDATMFLMFVKNGPFPVSFSLYFCRFNKYLIQLIVKRKPMNGVEPRISGIVSNHSTN